LGNADLSRARLNRAHLEGTLLVEACLERADVRGAHLEGANLAYAHLAGALASKAYLEGANLSHARLEGAVLQESRLLKAQLQDARMEGVNLRKTCLGGSDMREVHLEGADLREAHLGGQKVEPADLERVRRWEDGFPEVLVSADLRGAFFDIASNLSRCYLGNDDHRYPRLADVRWRACYSQLKTVPSVYLTFCRIPPALPQACPSSPLPATRAPREALYRVSSLSSPPSPSLSSSAHL
jgi:uncharacterized protein YjbI with pentapeptide repeats